MVFADADEPHANDEGGSTGRSLQHSANGEGLAERITSTGFGGLAQVLLPQRLLKQPPTLGREPETREEPCLESANRMAGRQDIAFQLHPVDDGAVGVRQNHAAF